MPPKYTILFLDIAREEFNDAKEYLDEISVDLGDDFVSEMDEMITRLKENPFLFQKNPQREKTSHHTPI